MRFDNKLFNCVVGECIQRQPLAWGYVYMVKKNNQLTATRRQADAGGSLSMLAVMTSLARTAQLLLYRPA